MAADDGWCEGRGVPGVVGCLHPAVGPQRLRKAGSCEGVASSPSRSVRSFVLVGRGPLYRLVWMQGPTRCVIGPFEVMEESRSALVEKVEPAMVRRQRARRDGAYGPGPGVNVLDDGR